MFKIVLTCLILICGTAQAQTTEDFFKYFKVDMKIEIPDLGEYMKKFSDNSQLYDKGYVSRFEMGNKFKKEFSKVIKSYGMSEGRIKTYYEDDLLDTLSMIPKELYQYIGPMLFEVPGMPEKILNLPGIKETKNQFPKDVAERFKNMEGIEYLSPALYFVLMPAIWDEKPKDQAQKKQTVTSKPRRGYVSTELPDFLKAQIGKSTTPIKAMPEKPKKKRPPLAQRLGLRTINPSLTSTLTTRDVEAFASTIDDIKEWATENDMKVYGQVILGEALLNMWEQENGTALMENDLKDAVNPCQRLVLKTRFSGLYGEFSYIVAQKGFTAEEWAYTCDRTVKAFRVAEANMSQAYAVQMHRRGYYKRYIEQLPEKMRDGMYATEAAIIRMYTVLQEDVDAVRPLRKELREKFIGMSNVMLTAPIIY